MKLTLLLKVASAVDVFGRHCNPHNPIHHAMLHAVKSFLVPSIARAQLRLMRSEA